MNSEPSPHTSAASSTAQKAATPSLADLLSASIRSQDPPPRTATGSAAISSIDTVVPMPFLRNQAEHFLQASSVPANAFSAPPSDTSPLTAAIESRAQRVRVPLVLVHGNGSDGAMVQTWIHRVLEGRELFGVRFQDNFAESVHRQQPQAILIQFIPSALDTAVSLASQLQIIFPNVPRIAVGHSQHPECMLAALRAGVKDFLDMDAPLETAQYTIHQLLSQPPAIEPLQDRAPITALVSARAGLGSSLAASHLASYLQQCLSGAGQTPADAEHLHCLLMEMGTPSGDCSIYLNTQSEYSLSDAASQHRRLDRRMAQSALARHDSGLRLLSQNRQSKAIAPAEASALLNRLGQYFEHIVLDIGATTPNELTADVLQSADHIWVLCDQSVASVVWTTELLKKLDLDSDTRERMQLVVARHEPKLELSAAQIARQLQLPLLGVIPERRRELAQAVNLGTLMPQQTKREPYVQAIDALLEPLLAQHHPALTERAPPSPSLWTGLLKRIK